MMYCNGTKVLIMFMYAKSRFYDRCTVWEEMEDLYGGTYRWMVVGDFNCIQNNGERISDQPRSRITMDEFNTCIDKCGVVE